MGTGWEPGAPGVRLALGSAGSLDLWEPGCNESWLGVESGLRARGLAWCWCRPGAGVCGEIGCSCYSFFPHREYISFYTGLPWLGRG